MHDILIALSVSFMAFVSTSMDNLFLLIAVGLYILTNSPTDIT